MVLLATIARNTNAIARPVAPLTSPASTTCRPERGGCGLPV
jgi:hypothetical protein